ncbi:MAG TPA: hypothetical protein VE732_08055 [Nitrososphaera sp.]|nr:hypothetical protein [Nitrososphaera sp.]
MGTVSNLAPSAAFTSKYDLRLKLLLESCVGYPVARIDAKLGCYEYLN